MAQPTVIELHKKVTSEEGHKYEGKIDVASVRETAVLPREKQDINQNAVFPEGSHDVIKVTNDEYDVVEWSENKKRK